MRNTADRYGWLAQFFHWTTAAAFIASYVVVYYVIWVIADNQNPAYRETLNIHWILGLLVGFLVVPRLIWKWLDIRPRDVPGTPAEHLLANFAHGLLYALMIVMPITGYLGTRHHTDFGVFVIPSFGDTAVFGWISGVWGVTFKEFEGPLDVVHHFLGKWVAWVVVGLHIAAAFFHHWVRRDATLVRMLPRPHSRNELSGQVQNIAGRDS